LSRVAPRVLERARRVRLMIFDVDGVMTDGALWYGPRGEELKRFHAYDGHGVKMLAAAGVPCAILSGRRSKAVALRAAELGIETVIQGATDKLREFEKLSRQIKIPPRQLGYMGDELVDLPVLERCGFACAPGEAPREVRARAHYVASAPAGNGAVREVCELLLKARA
jgi:3-deoxy-D-manno-octulosonate 8-phosphate phosphatase (KDO 8-P phosphatase)